MGLAMSQRETHPYPSLPLEGEGVPVIDILGNAAIRSTATRQRLGLRMPQFTRSTLRVV